MNSSTPVIRLSLFALTGAMILGAATINSRSTHTPAAANLTTVTLPMISVRPSTEEIAAANITAPLLPMLPTVYVYPSEEEVIAARIDPTDRIQIMSTISVYPDAKAIAAAAQLQPAIGNVEASADDENSGMFDAVLTDTMTEHHRLRLDMPYYSFGRVLAHARKN